MLSRIATIILLFSSSVLCTASWQSGIVEVYTINDIENIISRYSVRPDEGPNREAFYQLDDEEQLEVLEIEEEGYRWYREFYNLLRKVIYREQVELSGNFLTLAINNTQPLTHEKAYLLLKLLNVIVESGQPLGLSPYDLLKVVNAIDDKNANISADEWTMMQCSYAYFASEEKTIFGILNQKTGANGNSKQFVRAYCLLKYAQLTNQTPDIEKAIDELEKHLNQTEGSPILETGKAALHLATAYNQLTDHKNFKTEYYLKRAVAYSAIAREKLELLKVPYLWAAAHYITSQVYQKLDGEGAERISDRAYLLSQQL